jgi:putative ABC transport system substrate-binding protein
MPVHGTFETYPPAKEMSVRRSNPEVAYPRSKRRVVGFLNGGSPDGYAPYLSGFLHGLNETGYVEGKNVTVDYQWAKGQYDHLQVMAADLVRRKWL